MIAIKFLVYWTVNAALIWVVGLMVPKNVVLGNQYIQPLWASPLTGFILATVYVLAESSIHSIKMMVKTDYQNKLFLLIVNTLGVYVVTRLALILGVGVTSIVWVGVVAIAISLGDFVAARLLPLRTLFLGSRGLS